MELYHSVPFFCYLLGKSLSQSRENSFRRVCLLGVSVLGTFVVVWFPYLGDWNRSMQVWKRLFPFGRGLYEDKVANVWCSLSVVVKLKQLLSLPSLLRLTTVATLTALVPSSWDLLRNPTPYRFILALVRPCVCVCLCVCEVLFCFQQVNSSLVFFLFSFQVHEKSILLAVLPASLLTHHHPHTLTWFQLLSLFSMYPLLTRDGLALPCWALGGLYLTLSLHLSPAPTGSSGWLHTVAKILVMYGLCASTCVCVCVLVCVKVLFFDSKFVLFPGSWLSLPPSLGLRCLALGLSAPTPPSPLPPPHILTILPPPPHPHHSHSLPPVHSHHCNTLPPGCTHFWCRRGNTHCQGNQNHGNR